MKRLSLIGLAGVLMLLASSCVHPEGDPGMFPASAQRIFKKPVDRVWNATLAVISEDLKLPIQEAVPETGLLSTKWVKYEKKPGDYTDANRQIRSRKAPLVVEYRVVILVKTSSEGTMVRVRRYQREFRGSWYTVPTNLMFERQLLNMVAIRLGVNSP